jgi:hypothetical protein
MCIKESGKIDLCNIKESQLKKYENCSECQIKSKLQVSGRGCKVHRKNVSLFPSPAGMSLTKLSLGGNNDVINILFPPRESLVSDNPAGDGNIDKLFLRCTYTVHTKG